MFSRFTPLAVIYALQPRRAVPGDRRNRPGRRPPDHRTGAHARFRLEGLEDRCLLSGISAITEFAVPSVNTATDGITVGPDGNLWYTAGGGYFGVLNPSSGAVSLFAAGYLPWGITAGPDGNLWVAESGAGEIASINPTTDAVTQYSIPYAGSVKASKGVAAFSGLTLTKVGTGYTLAVSSSGLTGATTSPITVTKTGADIVLSGPGGTSAPDPLLAPLVLDSPDLWAGLGLKKRVLGT